MSKLGHITITALRKAKQALEAAEATPTEYTVHIAEGMLREHWAEIRQDPDLPEPYAMHSSPEIFIADCKAGVIHILGAKVVLLKRLPETKVWPWPLSVPMFY